MTIYGFCIYRKFFFCSSSSSIVMIYIYIFSWENLYRNDHSGFFFAYNFVHSRALALAPCSFFIQSSATSLASGSLGLGLANSAWMDSRTVLICKAGDQLVLSTSRHIRPNLSILGWYILVKNVLSVLPLDSRQADIILIRKYRLHMVTVLGLRLLLGSNVSCRHVVLL